MNTIFEGSISCKAVLENEKRKAVKLYVDKKKRSRDFAYIIALAKNKNIPVIITDRAELDEISQSKSHGGILLEAGPRKEETILNLNEDFYCYVNGVEDPYNLGSVCRTLYAFGCNGLFLPKRDWSFAEKTILRASAGAYEKMDIFYVENDENFCTLLHKNKLPLICADRKDAVSILDYKFPKRFCLAVGGALRGLSAVIEKNSSQNVYIEYGRDFKNALDTASAVAVFAFDIAAQKKGR